MIFYSADDSSHQGVVVEIENDTNEEVNLLDAKSSCGCTIAKLEPSRLDVGESTQLVLDVDTKRVVGVKTISVIAPNN